MHNNSLSGALSFQYPTGSAGTFLAPMIDGLLATPLGHTHTVAH